MINTDELKLLKEQLRFNRPESWDQIPDIDLYMDQVISYMERQHIGLGALAEENLTPAMVNNYVKRGLLPRAKGKKYSKEHMAYLTAICLLKQVLSVDETGLLMEKQMERKGAESFYRDYTQLLDRVFSEVAGRIEEESGEEQLIESALTLAVESYARMLACKQMLKSLQTSENEEK